MSHVAQHPFSLVHSRPCPAIHAPQRRTSGGLILNFLPWRCVRLSLIVSRFVVKVIQRKTALALAHWLLPEIIRICMRVLRIIARLLHGFESHIYFTSKLLIVWKLSIEGGNYSRTATIWRWQLFEDGNYSRVATIQGQQLFKGGNYSRMAVTIQGRCLFKYSIQDCSCVSALLLRVLASMKPFQTYTNTPVRIRLS